MIAEEHPFGPVGNVGSAQQQKVHSIPVMPMPIQDQQRPCADGP